MSRPALDVVITVLRHQLDDLVALEAAVREDRAEAVHDMRTTVRRLRTTLATSSRVLDAGVTDGLRERLAELGVALEPARDAEVRGELAASLLAETQEPGADVRERLVDGARDEYQRDRRAVVALLDRPEHAALIGDLAELVHRPPLGAKALHGQRSVLRSALRRAARRAHRRLGRVDERDLDSLHAARKAVRRVRYLAEAMAQYAPNGGGPGVRDLADAAKRLQDSLGDHRDAALHARWIGEQAVSAERAGENPDAYRRLEQIERARADRLVADRGDHVEEFERRRAALG